MKRKLIMAGLVLASCFQAALAATWYVDASVDSSGDGTTLVAAKKTIQEGIDAASAGDTVQVADGTYTILGGLLVDKAVTMVSENGPESAIIDGRYEGTPYLCMNISSEGATVSGFTFTHGDGGVQMTAADVTLANCIITACTNTSHGGGVYQYLGTVTNCTITGNQSSQYGGGIWCSGGTVVDCTISDNRALQRGGGAYLRAGLIENCTVDGNTASYQGGGIYTYGLSGDNPHVIKNCTITDNSVTSSDGGAGAHLNANSVMSGCLVKGNSSPNYAGVRMISSSMINCTVVENTASGWYGGVTADSSGITNCICWNNEASNSAGADFRDGDGESTLVNSCATGITAGENGNLNEDPQFLSSTDYRLTFSSPCIDAGDNSAVATETDLDGAVRILGAAVDMGAYEANLVFVDGSVDASGDGASWDMAFKTIQEAVDAATEGASVIVTNGTYTLTNTLEITNNISVQSVNGPESSIIDGDGAVRCVYMTDGTLSGVTLTNGYAATGATLDNYGGGALLYYGGSLANCVVVDCEAESKGGGACLWYGGTMNNCTVAGNTAIAGGGCYMWGGGTINNSILWDNTATGSSSHDVDLSGSDTLRYCCASQSSILSKDGCITNNPLFVSSNDLHLQETSPCINAGANAYVTTSTDADGLDRILGGSVDMGAYEADPVFTAQTIELLPANGYSFAVGSTTGLTATASSGLDVELSVLSGPATLEGTNLTLTGVGTVVVAASQNGNYAYSAATPVTNTYSSVIYDAYVDGSQSDDSGDSIGWDSAKQTIEAAIDVVEAGGTVWVTNGTYSIVPDDLADGDTARTLGLCGATVSIAKPANYQYYRFSATKIYDDGSELQYSELQYFLDDVWAQAASAAYSGSSFADSGYDEGPEQANDNSTSTKFGSAQPLESMTYDFGSATELNEYNWCTGNDLTPDRNPVRWIVEGSSDSNSWVTLDARTAADEDTPTTTYTWAGVSSTRTTGYEISSADAVALSVIDVIVTADSTLELGNASAATLGSLSFDAPYGTVLTVTGTADAIDDLVAAWGAIEGIDAKDIGTTAYFSQSGDTYNQVYVDGGQSNDSGDGLSWATAKQTLAAGVDTVNPGGTIWLTNGTFTVDTTTMANYNAYGITFALCGAELNVEQSEKYRYYRFGATHLYNAGTMQFSELQYFLNNSWVTASSVDYTGEDFADEYGEGPNNANDNNTGTKFCTDDPYKYLVYDFGSSVFLDEYNWCTANDLTPARNPLRWAIEGSNNGSIWTMLDDRTGADDQNTPSSTYQWAGGSAHSRYTGYSLSSPAAVAAANTGIRITQDTTMDLELSTVADFGTLSFDSKGITLTVTGTAAAIDDLVALWGSQLLVTAVDHGTYATFTDSGAPRVLTIVGENGSIDVETDFRMAEGGDTNIVYTAAEGYTIESLTRDGVTVTNYARTYTQALSEVAEDTTNVVTFTLLEAQTISNVLPTDGSTFWNSDAPTLSADASSGLDVEFAVLSGPGAVDGTNLTFSAGGTVVLEATQAGDGQYAAATSVTNTYTVKQNWYVDAAADGDSDGASWDTAYSSIQTAVNAASVGETIWVTNGTYSYVNVNKDVTIRSVNGSEVTIIDGNGATRCVYMNGGTLSGMTLTNGYYAGNGGCAYVQYATVTNCTIVAGSCSSYGGGIFANETVVSDCVVSNNSGGLNGGVFIQGTSAVLENSLVTDNTSGDGAGGVHIQSGVLMKNCTVSYNSADSYGGGIVGYSAGSIITNCVLEGNTAATDGGGVYVNAVIVTDCTLTNNTATRYGGGAYLNWGGTLTNCTLSANTAGSKGGGATLWGSGGILTHCVLDGNSAPTGGGAYNDNASIYNCLITGNTTTIGSGGGVYQTAGTLRSCTISGNAAADNGGGVYLFSGSSAFNLIVWGNSAGTEGQNLGGSTTIVNCCAPELDCTDGNLPYNPQFVDADHGDYRLSSISLCINAGDSTYASWSTDLDGNVRTQYSVLDMGAYESATENPATSPTADNVEVSRKLGESFKLHTSELLAACSDPNELELGIESIDSSSTGDQTVTLSGDWIFYSPAADYNVSDSFSFSVTNSLGTAATGQVLITVVSADVTRAISIKPDGTSGDIAVTLRGIPGRTVVLQAKENLMDSEWTELKTGTFNEVGILEYTETDAPDQRYYRLHLQD